MAINPEAEHKHEATIKYKNWTAEGATKHEVVWVGLVEPWKTWDEKNNLEAAWKRIPRGPKAGPHPFPAEEQAVAVEGDTGEVQVEWTVWDESKKLRNLEVEHYSVMRAEKHFIRLGYTKVASKYVRTFKTKSGHTVEVEDCGVDNFFKKGEMYVFCESKFTRNPTLFESWKADEKKVWQLMGRYTANGKRCRQMSWDWIQDRAMKAVKNPAGTRIMSAEQRAERINKVREMSLAAQQEEGERYANIYGAAHVPIYPGEYQFICAEGGVISTNTLSVDWPFEPLMSEFVELGQDFDEWLENQSSQ